MADMHERERIIDEIEGQHLTATIANEARYSEITGFLQRVVDECGMQDTLQVVKLSNPEMKTQVPEVKVSTIYDKKRGNTERYIFLEFDYENMADYSGHVTPKLDMYGIGYAEVKLGNPTHDLLVFCIKLVEKFPELEALVNDDVFMSYRNDINAYFEAQHSLKAFDADAKEERIKKIASMFKADDVIVDSKGERHTVLKACNARLYMTNLKYYNGDKKKSLDKMDVARWIESGSWARV